MTVMNWGGATSMANLASRAVAMGASKDEEGKNAGRMDEQEGYNQGLGFIGKSTG